MTKRNFRNMERGSALRVLAHAKWCASRGRGPSMGFLGERNPRKALKLAVSVGVGQLRAALADVLMVETAAVRQHHSWRSMSDQELESAVSQIIRTSSSEDEVRARLLDELEYPYGISMHVSNPDDDEGREAREIVRGLGGLVMRNGAMVMAMMRGHDDVIFL